MALTRRQRQVLDVIRDFIARNGYSPSLEEIGTSLNLSSVATVHKHVTHLVEKGYVRRAWNQNRSIEIIDPGESTTAVEITLAGSLSAGRPIAPQAEDERIRVPAEMIRGRGRTYALRASGDTLHGEHVRDGDVLVIEEREIARDGETVVALIDGSQAALGRYYGEGDAVQLQPASDDVTPTRLPSGRVRVHGVVVGLLRAF